MHQCGIDILNIPVGTNNRIRMLCEQFGQVETNSRADTSN